MKTKLIILTSLIAIACTGQQPDAYSQKIVDSLNAVIDVLEVQNNQQSIFIGVQGLQISELTQDKDSLIDVTESYLNIIQSLTNPVDTLFFVNDTISVSFLSDSVRLNISKIGDRFNYQLIDGLHRLNIWYDDKKFTQLLMYDKASYDSEITTFAIPIK
jgi:hypothetical protein